MGTMVIALDPQGNPFGLWQSGMHTGVRIHNEPGALAWNEAMVDDTAAAKRVLLGRLRLPLRPDGAEGRRGHGLHDVQHRREPAGRARRLRPEHAEGLADLLLGRPPPTRRCAAVEASGGKVTMPAMDTPFGRFAIVEDPWGAPFEVMQDPPA